MISYFLFCIIFFRHFLFLCEKKNYLKLPSCSQSFLHWRFSNFSRILIQFMFLLKIDYETGVKEVSFFRVESKQLSWIMNTSCNVIEYPKFWKSYMRFNVRVNCLTKYKNRFEVWFTRSAQLSYCGRYNVTEMPFILFSFVADYSLGMWQIESEIIFLNFSYPIQK